MNDSQFDDFFNDKLRGLAAPVPANLWEKVSEGQFDQFVGGKLKDGEAPVPGDLWDKISDAQFDNFVVDKLFDQQAPVPGGLFDRITDGQFDGFVGDKLKDHESPVPAGLWEKVKPEEDDDRTAFMWFRYPAVAALLIGVLVAAGTIGGYFYFTKKNSDTEINANKTNDVTAPADKSQEALKENNTAVVPPVVNDQKADPSVADPKTNTDANGLNNAPANNSSSAGLNNSNPINKSATREPASSTQKNNPLQNNYTSSSPVKKEIGVRPADPVNNDVTTNSYDPFSNNKNSSNTNTADRSTDDNYIESYKQNLLTGSVVPFGLGKYSGNRMDKELSTLNHTNQFKSIIICPTDRKGNQDWYLEPYVSGDFAFKSVSNISASQLYMLKKDSSESMQVGFSAGIRLVKPITDNILVKAGIQYTQANEKYVYRTENEVKTTTVVTVRTIIRAPGDTVIVNDTSVVQTAGFRTNMVRNHYRSFDIPVTVGYQFGNEDLKFGVNAGVVVNLSSWYEGVILDPSLATVTLNKSGNQVYKSNIGLGLIGSVSVVKRLSDDLHIFAEPYFRYNLSNMTTPQSSFKQKFSLGGIAVGLRFNLNRK